MWVQFGCAQQTLHQSSHILQNILYEESKIKIFINTRIYIWNTCIYVYLRIYIFCVFVFLKFMNFEREGQRNIKWNHHCVQNTTLLSTVLWIECAFQIVFSILNICSNPKQNLHIICIHQFIYVKNNLVDQYLKWFKKLKFASHYKQQLLLSGLKIGLWKNGFGNF